MYINIDVTMPAEFWQPRFFKICFFRTKEDLLIFL